MAVTSSCVCFSVSLFVCLCFFVLYQSPINESEHFADRYLGESTRGIDPDLLAQQLEDMQGSLSPGGSHSSSQQDMYLTPSVSMSSSEQTDTPSPSVEVPPHVDKVRYKDSHILP